MTKHGQTLRERLETGYIPEPNSGCWLWAASHNRYGYATITVLGRGPVKIHRLAYEQFCGEIPKGMHVLHKCDVRACCNPDHLFLGTNADNVADKVRKNRQAKGERYRSAMLTDEMVRQIRADTGTSRALAKKYGISKTAAHAVISGQAWRHVQ